MGGMLLVPGGWASLIPRGIKGGIQPGFPGGIGGIPPGIQGRIGGIHNPGWDPRWDLARKRRDPAFNFNMGFQLTDITLGHWTV